MPVAVSQSGGWKRESMDAEDHLGVDSHVQLRDDSNSDEDSCSLKTLRSKERKMF